MIRPSEAPWRVRSGGSNANSRTASGRGASPSNQSMASEWLEALVQNNEEDAHNMGDFFANRDGRARADNTIMRKGPDHIGVESAAIDSKSRDSGLGIVEQSTGDGNSISKASFPDTDGISSLLLKQQQASKSRAVSASRKRRSRWILSRDGSQTGRESHASWNNSALDSRGRDGRTWYSDECSGSSDDESLDDIEKYQIMKTEASMRGGRVIRSGGMSRSSDKDSTMLRLDQSTTLLQLQRSEKIRDAQWLLAHANNPGRPRRFPSPSPPPPSPSSLKYKNKQQRRNHYQIKQFALQNNERELGSRQLHDAYADTVATESKLRSIMLHGEDTVRKGLMKDLQNQLNLHLSAANACLASAVSAAVGEGEEAKHASIMQSLRSIANAQKRQFDLSQQFRELRNRLDDVLTNATPLPGSLNYERGKRRRARDRLREQLSSMLERQEEDRSQVRVLKETAKRIRLQIREQNEEMDKVRTAWNLATDGLFQSRSATPTNSHSRGRSVDRRRRKMMTREAHEVQERGTPKSRSPSQQHQKHIQGSRSPPSRSRSRSGNYSRGSSRVGTRGASRALTLRSEAGSPLHVTARDLETGSPLHMSEMQSRLLVDQNTDNDAGDGIEDEEELEWKDFEMRNNTNVGLSIMPQEYVDAQFTVRLRSCQTGFREIEKELQQTVRCDVCSKRLTNPRITRACSHVMCFRCLGTNRPGADASRASKNDMIKNKSVDGSHIVCPVCGTVTEARSDGIMSLLLAKLVPFNAAANTAEDKR